VNKASEIEISVHDQSSDKSLPIGIFWLKINDITEGLRKRKIPQWIMSQQQQQQQDQLQVEQDEEEEEEDPASPLPSNVQTAQNADEGGIEAWFDVEPVGKMALRVNFVRTEGKRRPMDKLGRVGALRQRREAVVEVNGHQFLEKRFYNVMKCALCQEFFVNSGYQCAGKYRRGHQKTRAYSSYFRL
jgi:hypothetical protein